MQSSPLPIFAVDAAGTVHVWNHACEELFGWTADEAIGSLPRFASADEIVELIGAAFSGETVRSHEARYERRDGEPLDVNVAVAPLRNADGRVVSAVLVVADVSDQKRAELAFRESEVRFRSLVQNSSDMVTIIAADGHVDLPQPERVAVRRPRSRRRPGRPDRSGARARRIARRSRRCSNGCGATRGASETIRYRFAARRR